MQLPQSPANLCFFCQIRVRIKVSCQLITLNIDLCKLPSQSLGPKKAVGWDTSRLGVNAHYCKVKKGLPVVKSSTCRCFKLLPSSPSA